MGEAEEGREEGRKGEKCSQQKCGQAIEKKKKMETSGSHVLHIDNSQLICSLYFLYFLMDGVRGAGI